LNNSYLSNNAQVIHIISNPFKTTYVEINE